MTSISKNVYIDKLDDIVNKYINTYHRTVKMKPADIKSRTYIDFIKKIKGKVLNLKLAIIYEKVFVIIIVKNTVPQKSIISDLKGEKIAGTFYTKRITSNK